MDTPNYVPPPRPPTVPDLVAQLELLSDPAGEASLSALARGRRMPLRFSFTSDSLFDGFLWPEEVEELRAGDSARVSIWLNRPGYVLPHVRAGDAIGVWSFGIVAEGTIIEARPWADGDRSLA